MSDKLQGGVLAGSTSVSVPVILRKTADNTEYTGILAANITAYYWRQGGTPTALTAATDLAAITSAFSAGGWKAADATNQPGVYRLDVDNAAFATGADWVVITVKVTSAYLFTQMFNLTTNVIQTGDSYARIGANGVGLTSVALTATQAFNNTGTWTGNIVGTLSTLTTYTGNTPQTGDAFAIVKAGGTGDNAAIKTKTDFLPSATAGAAGGLFIAGANAATSITTALTANIVGNITGNLSGSVGSVTGAVGSVTGAVGSVTGNVGGNVVGSVGSVTAGVTVTTNNDKTGYSLTQSFPANFSSIGISAGGIVSADIKYVNAILVNGAGTGANPWGP